MKNCLDLQLVQRFVAAVRGRGAVVLSSLSFNLPGESVSTPMLAWLHANRQGLPPKFKIQEMLEFDRVRQRNIVGHSIFKSSILHTYPDLEQRHQEAMAIVKQAWPDFADLIATVNPRISFQAEDRAQYESISDPKTFGEITYNMKDPCPVHWAEILVHEIAHHLLTVLLGTTPISTHVMQKFKENAYSHQRRAERPLIGIVHGVFAQSCILIFATNILLQDNLKQLWNGARRTFDRFAHIFPLDHETARAADLMFHPSMCKLADCAFEQIALVSEGATV